MAGKTITQRIGLDGGDDVRKGLEAIGAAGQEAFKKLQDASTANTAMARFGATIDEIKAKAAALGASARQLGSDFNDLGDKVASSAKRMAVVSAAVVGIIAGFGKLVLGAGEAVNSLRETAEQVGLTTDELSKLQFAFAQNGVNGDQLTKGLLKLTGNMETARQQSRTLSNQQSDLSKEFTDGKISIQDYSDRMQKLLRDAPENGFSKLGISVTKANGQLRNTNDVLLDVADAFKKLPDEATKSATAIELFGTRNTRMLSALNQGRAGITALGKESERVAPAITKLQEIASQNLEIAFETLKKSASSAEASLLNLFAPAGAKLADAFTEAIVRNRAAAFDLASAIASKVQPVVDDFIAVLEGRDKDVKGTFIIGLRDGFVTFGTAVKQVVTGVIVPAFNALFAVLNTVAQAFNGIFGTQISGQTIAITLLLVKLTGVFGILTSALSLAAGVARLFWVALGGPVAIVATIIAAIVLFVATNDTALATVTKLWTDTWNGIAAIVQGVISGLQNVGSDLAAGFQTIVDAIVSVFTGLSDTLGTVFAGVVAVAQAAWKAIVDGAVSIGQGIVSAFQSALAAVGGFFKGMFDGASSLLNQLFMLASKVATAIKAAFGGDTSASGQSPTPAQGFAGGGAVRGPGSGKSDSIWAKLSNGEYVIREKAVSHFGVGFFDALNRFDFGGMANRMASIMPRVPHFADGGLVAVGAGSDGGRPFVLNIGGESIGGLTASPSAVVQLTRHANRTKLTSAGRKPSWF